MHIAIGSGVAAVVLLALAVAVQAWRFERGVAEAARRLFALRGAEAPRVALDGLPAPVRRFAEASGAARRAPIRSVRVIHAGTFRPALDGPPRAIRGVQYFSAEVPGFVWSGRVSMAPGLWVVARDSCLEGAGRMLVRIESSYTLADARGPATDEASLLRLLAELAWFPTSLLDPRHVRWSAVDDASAIATLRVAGREVSGTFRFGSDGLPVRFEAPRPFDDGGERRPWFGEYAGYREVDGVRLPFRAGVSWMLDGKPVEYARWELERVELDRPEPF